MNSLENSSVLKLVEDLLPQLDIHSHSLTITPGSTKGSGYASDILRISAVGVTRNNSTVTRNFIAKKTLKFDEKNNVLPSREFFLIEIHFYKEVVPVFEDFQRSKSLKKPFESYPHCFVTNSEEGEETLLFEDLKAMGFETWNRKIPMDDKHTELALREYGRFHALSFALRDQKLGEFQRLTKDMRTIFWDVLDEKFVKMWEDIYKNQQDLVKTFGDEELTRKYSACCDGFVEIFGEGTNRDDPHSVILHGDNWCGNMMFRTDERSNPVEMKFHDFQIQTIGSPLADVLRFIFLSSGEKVLENFGYFMRVYYDSLCSFLRQLGSDPKKVFPEEIFEQHVRKYGRHGMIYAASAIKFSLLDESEVQQLDKEFLAKLGRDVKNHGEVAKRIKYILFAAKREGLL